MVPAGGNVQEQLDKIFAQCDGKPSDLIPILQDIQDVLGYVPREAMSETARFLNMAETSVYGVVTFYTQFCLTPQGKHKIKICEGTACHVRGSREVSRAVEKKLGIKSEETTEDFLFSLERVACLGSCALAPVIMVDKKVHGAMTPAKMETLIDTMRDAESESDQAEEC